MDFKPGVRGRDTLGGHRSATPRRGAFLASGSLSEPGRSASLEVACPSSEAAMALVGGYIGGLRLERVMVPLAVD